MNTFDLERAVVECKRVLCRNPALEDGQAAELEACLRDEVEELIAGRSDPETSFRKAVAAMGPAADTGPEFYKAKRSCRSARPLGSLRFHNAGPASRPGSVRRHRGEYRGARPEKNGFGAPALDP